MPDFLPDSDNITAQILLFSPPCIKTEGLYYILRKKIQKAIPLSNETQGPVLSLSTPCPALLTLSCCLQVCRKTIMKVKINWKSSQFLDWNGGGEANWSFASGRKGLLCINGSSPCPIKLHFWTNLTNSLVSEQNESVSINFLLDQQKHGKMCWEPSSSSPWEKMAPERPCSGSWQRRAILVGKEVLGHETRNRAIVRDIKIKEH